MTRRALAVVTAVTALALLPGCGSSAVQPESAPARQELQVAAGTAVTVQAEVAGLVSPRAFTIVRAEGGAAEPLLVVPDRPVVLSEELPVTVTGTIGVFSADEHVGVASPARLNQYDGRPYLRASEVRTGDGSSLSVQ